MTYVVLALGVFAFVAGLKLTGVAATVSRAVADIGSTATILRSATASEGEKETAARASAVRMARLFVVIVASLLVALALPLAVLAAADSLGICTMHDAMRDSVAWPAIVGASCLTVVILKVWR